MKLQKDVSLTRNLKETRKVSGSRHCAELLLSVHNPILVKKPLLNEKGEKCTSFQSTITMSCRREAHHQADP